jgi:hypothetical protein
VRNMKKPAVKRQSVLFVTFLLFVVAVPFTAEQRSLLEFFDNKGVREQIPANDALKRWLSERAKYKEGPKPKLLFFETALLHIMGF